MKASEAREATEKFSNPELQKYLSEIFQQIKQTTEKGLYGTYIFLPSSDLNLQRKVCSHLIELGYTVGYKSFREFDVPNKTAFTVDW